MFYVMRVFSESEAPTNQIEVFGTMSTRDGAETWMRGKAQAARNCRRQLTLVLNGPNMRASSVPRYIVRRLGDAAGVENAEPAQWSHLFNDPLALLKLAARSVELEPWVDETPYCGLCVRSNWWHPLKDGKDLLDLAVKQGIELHPGRTPQDWPRACSATAEAVEPPGDDRGAALRLAAVKVAVAGLLVKEEGCG